jgi:hypothetical protein
VVSLLLFFGGLLGIYINHRFRLLPAQVDVGRHVATAETSSQTAAETPSEAELLTSAEDDVPSEAEPLASAEGETPSGEEPPASTDTTAPVNEA